MTKSKNKSTQKEIHNYESYAVLTGGKGIVVLDSSDIATDQNVNPIAIKVEGHEKEIEFIPRGRNNNLPFKIMDKVAKNVTVSTNIEFKSKVACGDSLLVYKKYRDEAGEIKKEEVLPEECPEIFDFLEDNNYNFIRHELANDLTIFYDGYLEYIFNADTDANNLKIVQIKAKESCCSRISKIDKDAGKSKWHGYSAEWDKGMPEDLIVTPLLDRQTPLRDLKIRMGIAPNSEGKNEVAKERQFIHNLRLPTPGRFYYSRPYWWSVFISGWYDFSSSIPVFKKSLLKNQMAIKYEVLINVTFWEKLYAAEKLTTDEKKKERKMLFLKDINDFLAGEENAGKSFVSHFTYDRIKGVEEKDIIIKPIDSAIKGGEYIEDSEEVSNTLCYAQGVHPSIIGAAPGKGKSINGTEARELFIIQQSMSKIVQDATLEPLYVVKRINKWPENIYFSVVNMQLTTLDKGTGAVKNTGINKETED